MDASFDKAFALLDQLATDTQELKDAEKSRKERLDAALAEVESVISRMKQANEDREMEAKRMAREINEIRDQIPRAIEKEKEKTEERLKDLNVEMKSLKTLVANRMQGGGAPGRTTPSYASQAPPAGASTPLNGTPAAQNVSQGPSTLAVQPPSTNGTESHGANGSATPSERSNSMPFSSAANVPGRESGGTAYSRLLGGKAQIPSWQLEAKKKSDAAKADGGSSGASTPKQNVNESGTVSEAIEGQA